jgi:hypothetical protein
VGIEAAVGAEESVDADAFIPEQLQGKFTTWLFKSDKVRDDGLVEEILNTI